MSENGMNTQADAAAAVKAEEVIEATTAKVTKTDEKAKSTKTEAPDIKSTSERKTNAVENFPVASKTPSDEKTKPIKTEAPVTKSTSEEKTNGAENVPVTPKTPTKRGVKKVADAEGEAGKVTPKPKAKRTPAKAKTEPTTPGAENDEVAVSTVTKTKKRNATTADNDPTDPTTPRKRRAAGKPQTPGRSISTRLEDASAEDKMLISMKDEGKSWAEIRKAWKEMTGEDTGNSTLPNRFNRLKANLIVDNFKDEDESKLLVAKAEVEKAQEVEFWSKVAIAMEEAGADKYPAKAIEKKFKDMQKKPAPVSVSDVEGAEADDNE